MSSTRNATASGLAESTQQQQQIGGDEANRGVACCFKKQTDSDPKQSGDKYREQRAPRTHRWRKRERLISTESGALRPQIRKRSRRPHHGINVPPRNVHCNDWREMVELTADNKLSNKNNETVETRVKPINDMVDNKLQQDSVNYNENDVGTSSEAKGVHIRNRLISGGSTIQHDWVEQTFNKRECAAFISTSKDKNRQQHTVAALAAFNPLDVGWAHKEGDHSENKKGSKRIFPTRWSLKRHTIVEPTDSYGTIEFQGGPHPFKAQYLRLNFDTNPADIMCLFENVWEMPPPKLIITIHGGITNFDLQPKLARVFRKGLLKAARTTGAWIFTTGIDAGVVRQVSAALESVIPSSKAGRTKIVSVGIAPWGVLKKREDLIGLDKVVAYHPQSFPVRSRFTILNNRHSFFLLVDNGTVGRYGADIILRRRLESYIAQKQKISCGTRSVPVVCVVLEGGTCTVRAVLDYVTNIPRVPVVICDGSGRASDLLAFAHQYIGDDGQMLQLIQDVFFYDKHHAECLLMDVLACVRQKNLITVFRLGGTQKQDVDYAILSALLKGQNLTPSEQLSLTLAWNRVDIAKSDIFVMGQEWPKAVLHNAMLEALIQNRVDFVRLLLENGVSMHEFLTIARLEELYNTDQGPPNTLYYIVRDVVRIKSGYRYRLPHIGLAIEKLMGSGFRSFYTSSTFRAKYAEYREKIKNQTAEEPVQHSRRSSDHIKSMLKSPASDAYLVNRDESRGSFAGITSRPHPPLYSGRHSASTTQQQLRPQNSLIEVMPQQIIGSRALSNHILWRTAYRRDHHSMPYSSSSAQLALGEAGKSSTHIDLAENMIDDLPHEPEFKYPFSDLLVWAVLSKRHDMALCMWSHGEEALAKSLVACKLDKSLSKEAAEDYLEVEVCEELRKYADEFRQLSLELLDHCYKQDDTKTLQLLTYELSYWGHETCLSLAVIVNHKQFLAHPCCQILLADLWHGGLRIRSNSNLKVIMGILFLPSIFLLEFKSREELMLQPQTAAEHQNDIHSSSSSSSESSSSSRSSDSSSEADSDSNQGPAISADRRRFSHSGSNQSIHLGSLFQSKRRRKHNPTTDLEMAKEETLSHQSVRSREGKQPSVKRQPITTAETSRPVSSILAQLAVPRSETMPTTTPNILPSLAETETSFTISKHGGQGCFPLKKGRCSPNNTIPEAIEKVHHSSKDSSSNATIISDSPSTSKPDRCLLGSSSIPNAQTKQNLNKKPLVPQMKNPQPLKGMSGGVILSKKRQIKFKRKLYEFFVAPITTFWSWTLSFALFLSTLTYVLLIRTPQKPTWLEWYLLAYIVSFGFEILRKLLMSEPKKFQEKLINFYSNYWNIITTIAVLGFIIGFVLRVHHETRIIGRIILAVDSVLWSVKLLDFLRFLELKRWHMFPNPEYFSVHAQFGPYITMAGKMVFQICMLIVYKMLHAKIQVMNMSSIVIMLCIALLAFGLARQSITYPDEEWHWLLLRNVFYKPYFMLYGEVYADEIDSCGDEAWDKHLESGASIDSIWSNSTDNKNSCVPGHWIPPFLMIFFLLIANILLISMLIAIFNNIFESTNKISQQIWLFQRYRQVMEYEATPFIPPPFTPIYHLYMILKYIRYHNMLNICCCFWGSCKIIPNLNKNCLCMCFKHDSDDSTNPASVSNSPQHHKEHPSNTARTTTVCGRQCYNREKKALFDFSLKLFLTEDQVEKIHDFEEECTEDLAKEKEYERSRTNEERLQRTAERAELILVKMNDLSSKDTSMKGSIHNLMSRLDIMEGRQNELLDYMKQLNSTLQQLAYPPPSSYILQDHENLPGTPYPHDSRQPSQLRAFQNRRSDSRSCSQSTCDSPGVDQRSRKSSQDQNYLSPPNTIRQTRAASFNSPPAENNSAVSSTMTVYYPLKSGEQDGVRNNLPMHKRTRTSTLGSGNDNLRHPLHLQVHGASVSKDVGQSSAGDNHTISPVSPQHYRSYGSLISHDHIHPGNAPNRQTSRKSISTRRWPHDDEYTSITDAIQIVDLDTQEPKAVSVSSIFAHAGGSSSIVYDEENRSKLLDILPHLKEQTTIDTETEEVGVEHTDEENDVENDDNDEEEFDEDDNVLYGRDYGGDGTWETHYPTVVDAESGSLYEEDFKDQGDLTLEVDKAEASLDDKTRKISLELPRVETPNSQLQRARPSFIQHQNSIFKDFEENVGRSPVRERGQSSSRSSKEFINFTVSGEENKK